MVSAGKQTYQSSRMESAADIWKNLWWNRMLTSLCSLSKRVTDLLKYPFPVFCLVLDGGLLLSIALYISGSQPGCLFDCREKWGKWGFRRHIAIKYVQRVVFRKIMTNEKVTTVQLVQVITGNRSWWTLFSHHYQNLWPNSDMTSADYLPISHQLSKCCTRCTRSARVLRTILPSRSCCEVKKVENCSTL